MAKAPRLQRRRATPAPPPVSRTPWIPGAILVFAACLVYANSLGGPFIFDDVGAIEMNPQIRDVTDLRAMFAPDIESPLARRPLVTLSFALNYAFGGLDPAGYHVVNVALHATCGLLVFFLCRLTLTRVFNDGSRLAGRVALAIALIWTVHPLNSEVVNYVTQRTEALMSLCCLATLYAAARAWDLGPLDRPPRGPLAPGARLWSVVAVAACAVGMACKESMVTVPVLVVLYDWAFVSSSFRQALRARWRLYLGLAATWAILAALMVLDTRTSSAGSATAPDSSWLYFKNQMIVIAHYLRLAIWPDRLVLYYGWPRPLVLADVWPYGLALCALATASLVAVRRDRRIGFLCLWFFVTLAPASSFVAVGSEVGAERRMYLPLIGLVALAVMGARAALTRVFAFRTSAAPAIAVAVVVLILGVVTMRRSQDYRSALTMAETVLAAWPSPAAHHMVGSELVRLRRFAEATSYLRNAADEYPPARFSLGMALYEQGQLDEATAQLERFVRDEPGLASARDARIVIGRALAVQGKWPDAIAKLREQLALQPADPYAHGLLAEALSGSNAPREAIPHYRLFLDAEPNDPNAWTGLAIALASTGDRAGAVATFRRASAIEPRNARFRLNLARALLEEGSLVEAEREATAAVTLDGNDASAREWLAALKTLRKPR